VEAAAPPPPTAWLAHAPLAFDLRASRDGDRELLQPELRSQPDLRSRPRRSERGVAHVSFVPRHWSGECPFLLDGSKGKQQRR
jgi:hypothetical protein